MRALWNIESDHSTLPQSSREFLIRMLPKTLEVGDVLSSLNYLFTSAVEVLGKPDVGHLGESDSKWYNDSDEISHQKVEVVQLTLLKLGKEMDKNLGQGNPVVLHCLALGKVVRVLAKQDRPTS